MAQELIKWAETHPAELAFIDAAHIPITAAANAESMSDYLNQVKDYIPAETSPQDEATHQDNLALIDYVQDKIIRANIEERNSNNGSDNGNGQGCNSGDEQGRFGEWHWDERGFPDYTNWLNIGPRSLPSKNSHSESKERSLLAICNNCDSSPTPTPSGSPGYSLQSCNEYVFPNNAPTVYKWNYATGKILWDPKTGFPEYLHTDYTADTAYGLWYSEEMGGHGVAPQYVKKLWQETPQECGIAAWAVAESNLNKNPNLNVLDLYHGLLQKYWYPFGISALSVRYIAGSSPYDLTQWMHQNIYPQANYTVNHNMLDLMLALQNQATPMVPVDDSPCAVYVGAHWLTGFGYSFVDQTPPDSVKSKFPLIPAVKEDSFIFNDSFDAKQGNRNYPITTLDYDTFDRAWSMNTTKNQLNIASFAIMGAGLAAVAPALLFPASWFALPALTVAAGQAASQLSFNNQQLGRTMLMLKSPPSTASNTVRQLLTVVPPSVTTSLPSSTLFLVNNGTYVGNTSDNVSPSSTRPDGRMDSQVRLNVSIPTNTKIQKIVFYCGSSGWSTSGGGEGNYIRASFTTSSFISNSFNFSNLPFAPSSALGYLDLVFSDYSGVLHAGQTLTIVITLSNGRSTTYTLKIPGAGVVTGPLA